MSRSFLELKAAFEAMSHDEQVNLLIKNRGALREYDEQLCDSLVEARRMNNQLKKEEADLRREERRAQKNAE